MTAAIPPACCAGADDAEPQKGIHRIGRADRGGFAVTDTDAGVACVGASELRSRVLYADADADTDLLAVTYAKPFLESGRRGFAEPNSDADDNRCGFQRGIDQRSAWRRRLADYLLRHGPRGSRRAAFAARPKTWMPGTRPGMTT